MKQPTIKSFIVLCFVLISFSSCTLCDHNCQVEKAYPKLIRPIIVIAKDKSWGGYSVIVRDIRDSTLLMGNMSTRGSIIGASYNVGDTIK